MPATPVARRTNHSSCVVQRRAKKDPIDQGGWSVFNTFWSDVDQFNPVGHVFLRGVGVGLALPVFESALAPLGRAATAGAAPLATTASGAPLRVSSQAARTRP